MHSSASLIALACLILAATPASAQTDRGAIPGAVCDPAGASMDEWRGGSDRVACWMIFEFAWRVAMGRGENLLFGMNWFGHVPP